ncbi:ankyrin [Ustulina deusta]|nr:ankyrin [Ustulina deusta]
MSSSSQQADKYAIHVAAREGKLVTKCKESLCIICKSPRSLSDHMLSQADPKSAQRKDDDGRLPIHWAASSNQHAIALLLSQQKIFDPNVEDDSGWTPLMIAASVKDGDAVVHLLLSRGADTALHFAASKNNLDVARKLFANEPPASARVRDKRGQYPLHRAAAVGSEPMVKLLLENRSPLNATDNVGYTALHHAIAEGHGHTAITLLKAGAETDKRDSDGYLALDLAPDKEVRKYIEREAENEGIEL